MQTKLKKHIKKILAVYLLDILFLALVFLFLLYARFAMQDYLLQVQGYEEKFNLMQSNIGNLTLTEITETELFLGSFEKLMNRIYIFAVFVIPIALFILYTLFGAVALNIIHNKKPFSKELILKFGIISIPLLLLLAYINNRIIIEMGNIFYGLYGNIILYFVLLAILIFLFALLYSSLYSCRMSLLPRCFFNKFKNINAIPYFAIFLALLVSVVYVWVYLFITTLGGRFFWLTFALLLLLLLFFSISKYILFIKLAKTKAQSF
ncbi:hypothetical protein HZB88_03315 [archaeon]|nr:hypothetical protein [archaeon]